MVAGWGDISTVDSCQVDQKAFMFMNSIILRADIVLRYAKVRH